MRIADDLQMIALEWPRIAGAIAVLTGYAALCLRIWLARRSFDPRTGPVSAGASMDGVLVAFASQTGFAHELATQTAEALEGTGTPPTLLPLDAVGAATLKRHRQAVFIVSTCREGDAPDNATRFVEAVMSGHVDLHGLSYAVLALGDHNYAHYCAFGRKLDRWLQDQGALARFPRTDLDGVNAQCLETWRHQLATIANVAELPAAAEPALTHWRLRRAAHLNPGSAGAPVYHVELEPVSGPEPGASAVPMPVWEAGDLLHLFPPDADAQPRAYSIASLPEDGAVNLLVRAVQRPDGSPGRMSGLLAGGASPGTVFRGRVRMHERFRLGDNATRPLILIGNGTGLAGLMGLLRQRVRHGDRRNWLLFGERNAAHDRFYGDEIDALVEVNLLARCDRVYSRDPHGEYVQDRLERAASTLRDWVAGGAAIYVCGNAVGMGPAVHETLTRILGNDHVSHLLAEGRYRRDVY